MKQVLNPETEVLQLGGGIVRYLEEYGADGHFRGKNYVFDHRLVEDPRSGFIYHGMHSYMWY